MVVVCLRSKFGYCKFGRNCDKKHYSEVCDSSESCIGKQCDKRHPVDCNFFRNYGRCKFGTFCAYRHPLTKEQKLEKEVRNLKEEVTDLKEKVNSLFEMLKYKEVEEIKISSDNTTVEVEETESKEPQKETETKDDAKTLEDIIRENSEVMCDKCDFSSTSKRGLKVHKAKMHSNVHPSYGNLFRKLARDEKFDYECLICDFQGDDIKSHLRQEHDYLDDESIEKGILQSGRVPLEEFLRVHLPKRMKNASTPTI